MNCFTKINQTSIALCENLNVSKMAYCLRRYYISQTLGLYSMNVYKINLFQTYFICHVVTVM